jgi:uncharacterized membrane protein YeaQ/YmgE (transglycosylase-associated protein family)
MQLITTCSYQERVMGIIIALVIGAINGLFVVNVSRCDRPGAILHLVVGMLGALLAVFFLMPLIGGPLVAGDTLDAMAFPVSFMGAAEALTTLTILSRRRANNK